MIKLRQKSLDLLISCLRKRNPSLIPVIEKDCEEDYSEEFYNQLRGIVGDELIEKGFDQNFEPNLYGIELEKLIDEIGRLFLYS